MKVVLKASLFEDLGVRQLELIGLIPTCHARGHWIATDPPFSTSRPTPASLWLQAQPNQLQREISRSLADGARQFVRASARAPKTLVVSGASCWDSAILSLQDARTLLSTPLQLLVENSRNDRLFVLAMLPEVFRCQLLAGEKAGRVEFEHAGGIGEMKKQLENLKGDVGTLQHIKRLRTWVMHDRDAYPNDQRQPSKASRDIIELCQELSATGPWGVASWQLGRRTIENYLPTNLLNRIWAGQANGPDKTFRRKTVKALRELRSGACPETAWVYDMKRGLRAALSETARGRLSAALAQRPMLRTGPTEVLGEYVPESDLDPVFRTLTLGQRGALALGFDGQVYRIFEKAPDDQQLFWNEYDRGPVRQLSREQIAKSILEQI